TYINHNGWNYDFLIDKAYDYDIISVIIDALANKSKKFSKFKEYAEKGENSHFDSSRFNSVFTDYLYEVYVDMNDDMIIHFDASEVINHIKKNSNYAEMFKLLS
ncbi:MAG: hypothetical protein LUG21_05430, partial [Clostridiales bacterium]|nr:hypothetical protein [Clostridiales bacterium]